MDIIRKTFIEYLNELKMLKILNMYVVKVYLVYLFIRQVFTTFFTIKCHKYNYQNTDMNGYVRAYCLTSISAN